MSWKNNQFNLKQFHTFFFFHGKYFSTKWRNNWWFYPWTWERHRFFFLSSAEQPSQGSQHLANAVCFRCAFICFKRRRWGCIDSFLIEWMLTIGLRMTGWTRLGFHLWLYPNILHKLPSQFIIIHSCIYIRYLASLKRWFFVQFYPFFVVIKTHLSRIILWMGIKFYFHHIRL